MCILGHTRRNLCSSVLVYNLLSDLAIHSFSKKSSSTFSELPQNTYQGPPHSDYWRTKRIPRIVDLSLKCLRMTLQGPHVLSFMKPSKFKSFNSEPRICPWIPRRKESFSAVPPSNRLRKDSNSFWLKTSDWFLRCFYLAFLQIRVEIDLEVLVQHWVDLLERTGDVDIRQWPNELEHSQIKVKSRWLSFPKLNSSVFLVLSTRFEIEHAILCFLTRHGLQLRSQS